MSHLPPPGGYGVPHPAERGTPPPRPGDLVDRLVARLVDWLVVAVVAGLVVRPLVRALLLGPDSDAVASWVAGATVTVSLAVVALGYQLFFETTTGRTPGKALMGLQVVGQGGARVTPTQSLRRNAFHLVTLLGLVPFAGPALASLAEVVVLAAIAWSIASDPGLRQGVHDRFARQTYVMKVR
ncbi:RDD family protein [Nocardioides sp. ChNu-153]|uniref:RDD family protein n=1 Tax=unclassified Nocardioides TaxID=2615069 RepID=UPI00240683F4|nr:MULTISPECIES: RDD family protein [unclassified Nocardioides]MDF9715279.1 RDD family protein [Nocardioides sp. ChNu-99]MDN7122510.1 RDD family protein [Nocardioides sp. ChNu-153]